MGSIVDAIHKKYAPEDDLGGKGKGGSGGGTGGTTSTEKRQEMRTLMATKAFSNWQDAAHEATKAKVTQLANEIAALEKK